MFFVNFFGFLVDVALFGIVLRVAYPFVKKSAIFRQLVDFVPKLSQKKNYSKPLSVGYETISDLKRDIHDAGIESSDLIVFVDFTKSNVNQGTRSFGGKSLHDQTGDRPNPYEDVIETIAATLGAYDDDGQIPLYGFGDLKTVNKSVFSIGKKGGMPLDDLLAAYKRAAQTVTMSGPTSYTPCIEKAMEIASGSKKYHIALILTDGCTNQLKRDLEALRKASNHPVSFVIVGVGDGPWDKTEKLDDDDYRVFDNLNFVAHSEFAGRGERKNDAFVLEALKELPEQFRMIQDLKMLE